MGNDEVRDDKKSPGALDPAHRCSLYPQGAKYITITQDTSPSLCSERRDKHLFRWAKTGGLGKVT